MENVLQDIRYGIRTLVASPGFSLAAIVALTLGIGANTAIFSITNAILLRSLPFPHSERIVTIWSVLPKKLGSVNDTDNRNTDSAGQLIDYRNESDAFDGISAFEQEPLNLEGRGEPERLAVTFVTTDFFAVLGARAEAGRTFVPEEYETGHDREILLSYGLWQRRFGGDASIVGQSVTLSGGGYLVVGVMPVSFHYPRGTDEPSSEKFALETDCWAPLAFTAAEINNRTNWDYNVVALLKPGKTIQQAQKELSTIAARNEERHADSEAGFGVEIVPMKGLITGGLRVALLMLAGAAGFVLLIACANVANLLLARAAGRQREIAIRAALGANRSRIIRQMLTESVMLAAVGGVLGLGLSLAGTKLSVGLAPSNIPRLNEVSVDLRVLAFTGAVALLTGVVFGLLPAIHASRPDLNEFLKEGSRGSSGGRRQMRDSLVVAEVALALVLVIGAGLMIRSIRRLYGVDSGYDANNVLVAKVSLPDSRYPTPQSGAAFYNRAIERIQALAGVSSVAGTTDLPLIGGDGVGRGEGFWIEGQPPPESVEQFSGAISGNVTVGYFRTMKIPLVRGREFTEQDDNKAPRVIVINQAFAKKFFPGEDPIGKRINHGAPFLGGLSSWQTIVGVAADTKNDMLDRSTEPEFYASYRQQPFWPLAIVLRTTVEPASMAAAVRSEIAAVDGEAPVYYVSTMNQIVSGTVAQRRFNLVLMSLFSVVALLLAAIGVYGVMSYSVNQRNHEIGIRMALGASRYDIIKAVVVWGMALAVGGIALGVVGAIALTRFMESLLFGVTATDPVTFVAAAVLLAVVALASNLIPARRATKVDPLTVLRCE
jgi:putative ABC transport system permease protein